MELVDLSANPLIRIWAEMGRAMSQIEDPDQVLYTNLSYMAKAYHQPVEYIHLVTAGLKPGEYRVMPVNSDGTEAIRPSELFDKFPQLPIHRGGVLGDLSKTPEPKLARNVDLSNAPGLEGRYGFVDALAVMPMYNNGAVQSWILSVVPPDMSLDDFADGLRGIGMLMMGLRAALTAQELSRATEWINHELESIRDIQRALLPEKMPEIPGLSIAASYQTFDRAGGDYYDFIRINKSAGDGWMFIIADASGHGPAAAVVVAMLHSLLHTRPEGCNGPAECVEFLNANLQSARIRHAFVTAWIGIYDTRTRELRYASAGHDAPLLMGGNGMRRLESPTGFPLGIAERSGAEEARVILEPGQTLVLYTDGITEALSSTREPFRIEGIERALQTCNGMPDCVILAVDDFLRDHQEGRRPVDDQTIVAIRLTKNGD